MSFNRIYSIPADYESVAINLAHCWKLVLNVCSVESSILIMGIYPNIGVGVVKTAREVGYP
jgi:hypothetical protein